MLRSRKRLGMFGALPPYLGGKRRLCPLIFRELDRIIPRRLWPTLRFHDAFLGGGSVSLYAKAQGFAVTATDIAERSIVIGRALIENSRVRLTREDVLRVLACKVEGGRIESTMSPSVFTAEQARFIDASLQVAEETADPAKANLVRLLAMRTALLCHAYAQVRKGTIHRVTTGEFESITESAMYHYVDGMRLATPTRLWELAQQINAGIFAGRATVMKRSVMEVLPEIEADVMYADPPYPGVMSYEKEYKVIDEILEGQSRPTSPFTAKDGAKMIDVLLERATHIPIWVLSLGNAVVGVEELEAKMLKHGRHVKSIALKYQHLPAVATEQKKATNEEFIVIGVDEEADLLRRIRPDRDVAECAAGHVVQVNTNVGGTQVAAPGSLLSDSRKQGQAALADQGVSLPEGEVLSEGHLRLDDPDAGLVEGPFHRNGESTPHVDGEPGFAGHDASASLGTGDAVKEESR